MHSRASRVARGWIAGSFATGVAATSHGLAAAAPSVFALASALVFAGVLGTFVIGRRPSLPRLTAIVAGSQLAFHLVFSYLAPSTAGTVEHHGGSAVLEPAVAHHGTDPGMWAAHALAMLVTILFLRRAELALWSLLRDALAAVGIARRLPAIEALPSVPRAGVATAPRHPVSSVVLSTLRDRGPPVAFGV